MSHILVLPTGAQRAGGPYNNADKPVVAAAKTLGLKSSEDTTAGDAEALILLTVLPADEIEQVLAENLGISWVQLPFAGVDSYLEVFANHPDIIFTSAKGCYAPPVAEHALALTLALMRGLPERAKAASWGEKFGSSLNGANIVIIGGGGIGNELVRLFGTFDTKITVVRRRDIAVDGADRTVTTDQLDKVLPQADVVVLAAAATPETEHLLAAKELAVMKPSAVLVNIARGTLIDTDALVKALDTGEIIAAGLDVTDPEPLPDNHPLWGIDNALITPHSADTPEMCIPLLNARIVENLKAFVTGSELTGLVDVDAGY